MKPIEVSPELAALEDSQLVDLAQAGDNEAFAELVNRYQGACFKQAISILRERSEAEDEVQNALWKAFQHIGQFNKESKFSTWLYSIALNAGYLRIRAGKKFNANEVSLENYAPYDESGALADVALKDFSRRPDSELLGREGVGIIMNAVNELPDAYRVVFHLMHEQGLTAGETAEVLGISLSSAKSRIHRAKLFLRDRLADYYYEMAR